MSRSPSTPMCSAATSHANVMSTLLASEVAMPSIDDVMTTIATREPIGHDLEDLRSFIQHERR